MAVFEPSGKHVLHSLKPCDLSSCTKSEIKKYFENSYDLYETLFTALKDESSFYKCPDRLRLPLIFYFGHTAAVYVNKLVLAGLLKERINFDFETLFETGVDEMSWDDTENYRMGGSFVWPKVSEVAEYRRKVRQAMLDVIENTPLDLPVTQESIWWAVFMGFEHERVHFETSSVLIRQLPLDLVTKPEGWKYGPLTTGVPVLTNPMIEIEEQSVCLGKPENFPSYGWDNEYGQWNVKVPAFQASKYLVTNREFLEFLKDGGYDNSAYWTKEGWKWKQFRKLNHPSFWVCRNKCKSGCGSNLSTYSHCNQKLTDVNHKRLTENWIWSGNHNGAVTNDLNGNYQIGFSDAVVNGNFNGVHNDMQTGDSVKKSCSFKFRLMFDVIDLPMDWPAEVNYHEAKAFCAWKGPDYRLPTEAEHHVMRGPQASPTVGTACDIIYQENMNANINLTYGSSTPVNMYPPSKAGICDVFGNVWEWAEDHFNGFGEFRDHHLYNDFSTPCFDGRHNMIMGSSWVSTGDAASRFARLAFRRHFFQHLGFRIVSNGDSCPVRLVGTPVFVLGIGIEDNTISLPGIDKSKAYQNSASPQYLDDADEVLHKEVLSGYGDLLGVENDADSCKQLVMVCKEAVQKYECPVKKALDIMCSVGRFSFELSKHFDEIIAIDHSGRLLDAAIRIQKGKALDIKGTRDLPCTIVPLDEIKANIERVQFQQFTWLPNEIGVYDFIALPCLHRRYNVKAWLIRLWEIINPEGLLCVRTNTQWDVESLKAVLESKFDLLEAHIVPLKREGLRKSDRCHSSITIWRLKR